MSAILTAAEMRAAEQRAIDAGTAVETLMERAGLGAAEAVWRYAGPLPALILCGPGNNGGDGYVVARALQERGVSVRVAALCEPTSPAAQWARDLWDGPVEDLADAKPAPLLIDALFGTGLARPLAAEVSTALLRLAEAAKVRVAIDLPSGVATDDGALLSPIPDYDLTVSFATLKPAHLLQPAAGHMGRIAVVDIGIVAESALSVIERPHLPGPGPDDHKYSRGYVAILAGEMPGAAALAAAAAARTGAGYVRLVASTAVAGVPSAVVQAPGMEFAHDDARLGAIVLGPGLGRGGESKALLERALGWQRPLVLDGDALGLVGEHSLRPPAGAILTPHAGEFARLFPGGLPGSKVDQTREAARKLGCVIVYKGPDTVVAAPDGRAAIAPPAPHWLASAGTGDVLAGMIGALRARGRAPFEAACVGAWLHGRAGAAAGAGLIADDLIALLPIILAECL
ncbi:NAD(P)H-hydrate dehydratase [Sphingosinicella sp. LY1275]|uniref:NAD(P)H-hydrate dehydratase n=1 Tax=Sphingosinicella sp. LY1275 TaxID=3095379 RepID=UPI002ADEEEEC|nr:NAD(P)H-hydrate dehydratase [Sphingosinicella sp. LY1275]MEA1013313.1 NAD(P)H-hydrate dehydratase [Sphingosinicella sp. LY1275]